MNDNVISMAKKAGDAKKWSPDQVIDEAKELLGKDGEGAFTAGKKLMVLCLDDTDGQYELNYLQAGMRSSEMVAMLDIAKNIIKDDMGY